MNNLNNIHLIVINLYVFNNKSINKTLCFITFIYINVSSGNTTYTSCLYYIVCFYNSNTNSWMYKTHFSGSLTKVKFNVVSSGINVKIQYTNEDTDNITTIQYYIDEKLILLYMLRK